MENPLENDLEFLVPFPHRTVSLEEGKTSSDCFPAQVGETSSGSVYLFLFPSSQKGYMYHNVPMNLGHFNEIDYRIIPCPQHEILPIRDPRSNTWVANSKFRRI